MKVNDMAKVAEDLLDWVQAVEGGVSRICEVMQCNHELFGVKPGSNLVVAAADYLYSVAAKAREARGVTGSTSEVT